MSREERLARAFKALANANRLRIYQVILEHSREQDQVDLARVPAGCAFGDFIQRLNVGAPTISHHVRELVEAGLITVTRQGRRRYCRINPDMYRLLSGFLARVG
ncbi:ArsR/SmtB family transcription factor [Alcanivorax hongdengensis]|uniref:ArsR/SmtB family transcription factor n=1 Tax=Alcanivorax hongdengensis TaxID=519051 RepID=UPI0002F73D40|nr:metalloregulator ArsR/SmtB family transcription factor [Alcanivorax hongdengensis]